MPRFHPTALLVALFLLCLGLSPLAFAQSSSDPPGAVVSLYRIAPG